MPNKAKLISFLVTLLFLFTTNGFSNVGGHSQEHNQKVELVLKGTFHDMPGEMIGLNGVVHSSVRLHENFRLTFKTLKNNKNNFNHSPFSASSSFTASFIISNPSGGIHKFNSRFCYIAFRCLII